MADRAEQLLEAVNILVDQRLNAIKFDTTIDCIIADASKAKQGEYTVSNGSANFIAYSQQTDYKIGDNVLVTIPNGDYDQQKIIVGKEVLATDAPYQYADPFASLIDITHNVINQDVGEIALFANGYKFEEEVIWQKNYEDSPFQGYDKIGIAGDFSSWLSTYNPVEGSYGLKLEVTFDNEWLAGEGKISVWQEQINDLQEQRNAEIQSITALYNQGSITQEQYTTKQAEIATRYESLINALQEKINNFSAAMAQNVIDLYLDSSENFYGNIYAFDSYYYQSAVFDLGELKNRKIINLKLFFYQKQNFKTAAGEYIPSPDFKADEVEASGKTLAKYYQDLTSAPEPDDFSVLHENLFLKNPYICFGYDIGEFSEDKVILYTQNSLTYSTEKSDIENRKRIEMRWVHEEENGIISVDINDFARLSADGYEVYWYRYNLGAQSPDSYAGVFWEYLFSSAETHLNETAINNGADWAFLQTFLPDSTKETEQIKAIIVRNGVVVARSNILVFTNELPVENQTQTDLSNALGIVCGYADENSPGGFYKDREQGMFFCYKKGNALQDSSKKTEMFSLTPTFRSSRADDINNNEIVPLTEATYVIWTFPATYTMLVPVLGQDTYISLPSTLGTPIDNTNELYKDIFEFAKTRYLLHTTLNTYVFYNATDETYEFVHIGDNITNQLNTSLTAEDSIIQHYYIASVFSPAKVNNLVQCEIVKNKLRYHAQRQFYFGQSGTSGSDYTLVLDFKNNVNALTLEGSFDANGNPQPDSKVHDYLGPENHFAMIISARLLDQNGKEVVDLTSETCPYNLTFDFYKTEVNLGGMVSKLVPNDVGDFLYPVHFTEQMGLSYFSGDAGQVYHTANYWIDDDNSKWQNSQYEYFYFDRVQHKFVVTPKIRNPIGESQYAGIQYYRRLLIQVHQESYKPKIVYSLVQNMNEQIWNNSRAGGIGDPEKTRVRFFIQDNGQYILDPNDSYNEAENYYAALEADATEDGIELLAIDDLGPDGQRLPKNTKWIHLNESLLSTATQAETLFSVNHAMTSLAILRITLSGFGNYDLVTYYPVPLRQHVSNINFPAALIGENYIRYYSDGELPDYYKNPYGLKMVNLTDVHSTEEWTSHQLLAYDLVIPTAVSLQDAEKDSLLQYVPTFTRDGILRPLPIYIPNAPFFGLQFRGASDNIIYWTQPILVYQDNYPSATINAWDGQEIKTDDATGSILASAVAAGKKESNNTFSGIMMGDWSRTDIETSGAFKQTGLYGFHKGSMSFAFKEDGTAFIGKDGAGRLYFAGDKALIYSASWLVNQTGLLLNFNTGDIQLAQKSQYDRIRFNSSLEFQTYLKNNALEQYMDEKAGNTEPSNPYPSTDANLYEFNEWHLIESRDFYNSLNKNDIYFPTSFSQIPVSAMENELTIDNDFYYVLASNEDTDIETKICLAGEIGTKPDFNWGENTYYNYWAWSEEETNNVDAMLIHTETKTTWYVKTFITIERVQVFNEDGTPKIENGFEVFEEKKKSEDYLCKRVENKIQGFDKPANVRLKSNSFLNFAGITFGSLKGTEDAFRVYFIDEYTNMATYKETHSEESQFTDNYHSNFLFTHNTVNSTSDGDNTDGTTGTYFPLTTPKIEVSNDGTATIPSSNTADENGSINTYNPFKIYYRKAGEDSADRFATMSSNEKVYPLSIGRDKNPSGRNFRVLWDGSAFMNNGSFKGNLTATGGYISGDMTVAGTMRGGTFRGGSVYTSYLEAGNGLIGGWKITSTALVSPDERTTLYSNPEDDNANIETDFIKIKAASSNGVPHTAVLGHFYGYGVSNEGNVQLDRIGLSSADTSIIIAAEEGNNIGIRSNGSTYIDSGYHFSGDNAGNHHGGDLMLDENGSAQLSSRSRNGSSISTMASIALSNEGKVTVKGSSFDLSNINASNQIGIYARFA